MKVRIYFNISALSARVVGTNDVSPNTKYHTRLLRDEHFFQASYASASPLFLVKSRNLSHQILLLPTLAGLMYGFVVIW